MGQPAFLPRETPYVNWESFKQPAAASTKLLRDLLGAITCNDRGSAEDAARELADLIRKGEPLPEVELLGPGDLRVPDPHRIRTAV